jgi:apolipoprotein N-acyltransferase
LAIATLRASETSTFIVRAAQSGISACIGPDGKLLNYLDVNEEGIFNCTISKAKFNSIFNKLQYSWLVVLILAIAYYYLKIVFQKKKIAKKGN